MNIAVIGTGYVGLVTGTVLSEIGHCVTCLDINEEKIKLLQRGKSPIYEPGLEKLIQHNMEENRLFFTTNSKDAFCNAEIIFIAVGTPQGDNGVANLTYIEEAALEIAQNVSHNVIVVVKSTVPVGTNDRIEAILHQNMQEGLQIDVVSNPEFLREGHAIHDTFHGDRIVIGAENIEAGNIVEGIYGNINIPVLRTDRKSAEMIKYASNAFLAVKISYINQISNLCEKVGADISAVADGMGMDKRIGRAFLNAGIGYGGSCFPKDTAALAYLGRELEVSVSLVESAIKANIEQRQLFIQKVMNYFDDDVKDKKIAILGLAFKPNTDDMREAPSVDIINALANNGAEVYVYDPIVKHTSILDEVKMSYAASLEECVTDADAVLLVTEWDEFLRIKIDGVKVFDGRNVMRR